MSIEHIIFSMKPLTQKQHQILAFIEDKLAENNPPSQREIGGHFGLSQNAVYQLIGYLKKKGYLIDSGRHRGLRLSQNYLNQITQSEGIPVIGRVAAGQPILAVQNIDGFITPNDLIKPSKDAFFLKVRGDSMVDAGILDGDLVLVRPGSVENGQIGVVMIDDEATVKKLYFHKDHIALEPANKKYKTKIINRDEKVRIIGKVINCFRTF